MNFLKKHFTIFIFTALLLTNASSVLAGDNLSNAFGSKLEDMGKATGHNTEIKTIEPIVGSIIKIFLSLLGIIFLVLMLYGGYLWMTDRGSGKSVEKAKDVIQASVIGLAIVIASYAITYFVISKMSESALK